MTEKPSQILASYNATINLAVAGASQLDRVLARVGELDTLARRLSANPINVFGRGQAGDIARTALKPFQDISRAIENGADAAANSVAKTNLLSNTFKTLASNVKIASKEYDDFIRVAGRAAAAAETQNKAFETAIDAERRAALGLQPQSVRDLEVARRKTFVENERRLRAAANANLQDELLLQQALLQLEEKSAAVANKELQARGEIARLSAQGVNAAAFRAAQTGTPLALPAFQERGLQLLDDSVRLNESNRRIERALNGERQRGVRFLEKQTAEEARQLQLGILGERTNRLQGQGRAAGAVPVGGFPVSGPLQSSGFRNTQKQVGKFGENLALGAGFPLLFGGGPGSVAGSVLGSFVGSGFGGQILGGAIGQILDQAIQKTAQLGSALQTLDISQIEGSGVRINANLETQISLLRQAGNAYAAQQLLQQEVLATTGAIPGTVEGITSSVNVLSSAWSEFTAAAGVTLGIIGAPFAAALGAVVRLVNLVVKGFNVAASGLAGLIQKTGEWVVELVAGGEALRNIQNFFDSLNPAIDEARSKYAPILSDLNSQVLLNRQLLELEKQKTTGKTSEGKDRNVDLSTQQRILTINADIDNEIREINKDITEATKTQVAEAVRLLNVKRNQKLEEVQIEAIIQRQRITEDARDKAAREAEKAAREAARAAEDAARAEQQIQERLRALTRESELTRQIGTIKELQFRAEMDGNKELQIRLQGEERIIQIMQGTSRALDGITDQRLRQAILSKAATEIDAARQETMFEMERLESERTKAYEEIIADLNLELALKTATTEKAREQLKLEAELAKIRGDKRFTSEQQEEIARRRTEIARPRTDTERLQAEANAVKEELTKLTDPINIITNAAAGIGDAFATSFKGIIDGSMTAREALASFFTNVADMFLDMAAQIIAKMITMSILNAVLGVLPGGGGFGAAAGFGGTFDAGIPAIGNTTNFSSVFGGARANGGPVSGGRMYMVGERGPELFVPNRSGTIVANDKMGGSTTNVVVNVDAKGSSVEGNEQGANQLGRVISAAVQSELIKQQRPGGILAR